MRRALSVVQLNLAEVGAVLEVVAAVAADVQVVVRLVVAVELAAAVDLAVGAVQVAVVADAAERSLCGI